MESIVYKDNLVNKQQVRLLVLKIYIKENVFGLNQH